MVFGAATKAGKGRQALLPEIQSFADLTEAEVIDVQVPREPAPRPASRTVQDHLPDGLVVHPAPADFPLRVAVVPDARLAAPEGAVIVRSGHLVRESLWDEEHWRRSFCPPPVLPDPVRVRGRHASIVSLWCQNYFHWMIEALPRLAVLAASRIEFDRLIVPEPLAPFQAETLRLLGFERERLVPFTGAHVQPDELVWVSPLAPVGFPTPFLARWLRESFGAPNDSATRRVYLRRRNRGVVNEKQLIRRLQRLGVEEVDPGGLSVADQIALFATVRVAVGPHGAAFTNSIFSRHLTAVEFYQPAHVNVSMTGLMAAAGHDHWTITGRRAWVRSFRHRSRNHAMQVSPAVLEATLDQLDG